jgi:hypothetical protein
MIPIYRRVSIVFSAFGALFEEDKRRKSHGSHSNPDPSKGYDYEKIA